MLAAAATSAATAVLMIQVAHRRHTGTASAGDTWEMALFANLLPAPWAASFESAAAGATTALIGAIACGSYTWTAHIVFQVWLAAHHAAEARDASHEARVRVASEAGCRNRCRQTRSTRRNEGVTPVCTPSASC